MQYTINIYTINKYVYYILYISKQSLLVTNRTNNYAATRGARGAPQAQ